MCGPALLLVGALAGTMLMSKMMSPQMPSYQTPQMQSYTPQSQTSEASNSIAAPPSASPRMGEGSAEDEQSAQDALRKRQRAGRNILRIDRDPSLSPGDLAGGASSTMSTSGLNIPQG